MNPPGTPPPFPEKSSSRRNVRAFVVVVCAIYALGIGGAVIYDRSKTPEYEATAKLKIFRMVHTIGGVPAPLDLKANTQIMEMQGTEIITRVAARLSREEIRKILTPYQDGDAFSGPLNPEEIVAQCVKITPERHSYVIIVSFRHPSRALAIRVANYFAEEIKRANSLEKIEKTDPMIEKLGTRLDRMKPEIEALLQKRATLTEADPEHAALSKEIKIRKESYAMIAEVYEEKKAEFDNMTPYPVQLMEPAAASDEPVNRNLGLAVVEAAAGATEVSACVVILAGIVFVFRRMRNGVVVK